MYFRRVQYEDGVHYILRQTYRENGSFKYRDLIDLGWNPALHIHYPGGNGFYINPEIEETLESLDVRYSSDELEKVFLPFIRPRIREILERSQRIHNPLSISNACPREELWDHEGEIHTFDKRRLHYLRFGRVDMGQLDGRSWKFLNVLLCKSRDEREAYIEAMEQRMPAHHMVSYVYTSFHLQSYFRGHILRNHPIGLDTEKMDASFLEEVCRLNEDKSFFAGVDDHDSLNLHPLLRKYVVFYFDNRLESDISMEDYINQFRRFRESRRRAESQSLMSVEEAFGIFQITADQFKTMSRKDLTRRFRRKAKKRHPDRGGDHDAFVHLSNAYEVLMSRK